MKKCFMFSLVIASAIIMNKANAQKGLSLSVKATPQLSYMYNKDDHDNNNYDSKSTFNTSFGIGAGYNFTNYAGVGVDVLYSLQGQKYDLSGIEYNQKVDYVKIPVYFSFNTDASKLVSFIGKVGPQVSFLTNAKLTDKDNGKVLDDTKDRFKTATFGGMVAAGAQFKLANSMYITALAHFDGDFTNAEDNTYAGYTIGRAKTYNLTPGVEVGFKYMLH